MPIGNAAAIIEHGNFNAVESVEPTGIGLAQCRMFCCRMFCLASELTHFQKHLTSRSSRSLTLTRTFGTPHRFAHGFAIFAQTALRTKRRLPGR